ncbi:Bud site selection protein BUD4 [Tolypocladium ophioglossoides CBS 100239]|uniref:Bud site selection protein BUD4 n=1 Tax=Tolypocladium ophioglossoides (strain CBS 100239) TaxID=1163406 RepID=A0A0L0NLT1_TOLOC|nr:Bud site selection protein BUD4 [Tolypocladium ophioglossoides CBS 100239]
MVFIFRRPITPLAGVTSLRSLNASPSPCSARLSSLSAPSAALPASPPSSAVSISDAYGRRLGLALWTFPCLSLPVVERCGRSGLSAYSLVTDSFCSKGFNETQSRSNIPSSLISFVRLASPSTHAFQPGLALPPEKSTEVIMASEPVHPLRIAKNTPGSSPAKMANSLPRPLSEISPTEKRRNSPSWRQYTPTKKAAVPGNDSSPFQSSPLDSATSPRLFWQNRNAVNMLYGGRSGSPSPTRRSSIERLQRASRVRNSNILALEQKQEYDPTRIHHIERPLAKVQGNSFASSSSGVLRSSDSEQRGFDSKSSLSMMSPSRTSLMLSAGVQNALRPASKDQASPAKSSLSPTKFNKGTFDPEAGTWSGHSSLNEHELPDGRFLHRHPKSVTFDAAPPQINEYEMATPDLSSIGTNSREGSYESVDDEDDEDIVYDPGHVEVQDDSFDASLEDTDKTPVVGPDDWRGDSPMIHPGENPGRFEGSPMPENIPSMVASGRPSHQRTDSANSNGDHRPLPPLPGPGLARSQSTGSTPASPRLSATAERMLGGGSHRSLPVPPPASASKLDIQSFGNGKMTLEERLRLMMLSDDSNGKTAAEQQRERRLRRGAGRDRGDTPQSEPESIQGLEALEEDDTIGDISLLDDYQMPSRISRESIMRRVNGNTALEKDSEYHFSSPAGSPISQRSPERGPERQEAILDPDVPIPSTEDTIMEDPDESYEQEDSVIITRAPEDHEDDALDLYQDMDDSEEDSQRSDGDDDESQYSDNESAQEESRSRDTDAEATTPRANSPAQYLSLDGPIPDLSPFTQAPAVSTEGESSSLPEAQYVTEKAEVVDYATEHAPASIQRPHTPEKRMSKPEYDGSGWGEPEDEYDDEPGTPDSVIHHPMFSDDEEARQSPVIPERVATVKSAAGSKLKTRVSNTPSDLATMREARRHVSHEVPSVPPIPEKHRNRVSRDFSVDQDDSHDEYLERHPSFKNRSLTLDFDLGLSLDQDFERVIEAQKVNPNHPSLNPSLSVVSTPARQASQELIERELRELDANVTFRPQRGYLMRQNTKLVTASDKDGDTTWKTRSANNSPVKQDRPQSWVVEPWNGQPRQKSYRKGPGTSGPIPPLPGHESNATALNHVVEEDAQSEAATIDSGERGRLFVKVMGVKDLDLPLPKSKFSHFLTRVPYLTGSDERTWFSLTLDNGVHCVTTAWLELARNAPIGQEFELVVPNDLEFQLTLNVKLEKPAQADPPAAAAKMSKPKTSTFSRVFASPKKRKELELRHKAEEERFAQQQREALARRNNAPTGYELLSPLTADDGSFGRAYVCLKGHESRCFGRPYMAEVACFNEWATEEESFASSVKSKRGNTAVVRRAPYKIGKLELQLLFVPRPKNSLDDDMPKSMNSCVRELKASEERLARNWEGHLSQQGGDCPYWRRRYFKLVGAKLTAYHEATRQPRAPINLSNAKRLIDDRRALTEKETVIKGGKRRRSAFAEEEEGYMFVEEGFRIRFNNGEVIDFYADTAEDKESWMKVLSDVIGRGEGVADEDNNGIRSRARWCEIVLKREEQLRRRAEGRRVHSRTKSTLT